MVIVIIFSFVQITSATVYELSTEDLYAEELMLEDRIGGGGRTITSHPEAFAALLEDNPPISYVRLNEIGIEALIAYNPSIDLSNIDVAQMGEETLVGENAAAMALSNIVPFSLPSSHDVSTRNTFPPMDDQNTHQSNSLTCAGWAFAYFQATNNIANRRGLNARTTEGGNNPRMHQIHPIWPYNLINGGAHRTTYDTDMINALTSFGGMSWHYFTQSGFTMTNYSTWYPTALSWERALRNRMAPVQWIRLTTDTNVNNRNTGLYQDGIDNLKRLLLNGYVVSFHAQYSGRHIPNWQTMQSRARPDGVPSPVNQTVVHRAVSATGGHFMTIVGWDDNIWIDTNGNGRIDPGELGAFKVANSEGTGFANNGFIWLSYDALRRTTGIPGVANPTNRIAAISDGWVAYLPPKPEYTPLLMAEVTLNTSRRAFVNVEIGISPATTTNPTFIRGITENHSYHNENSWRIAFNAPHRHRTIAQRGTGINWTGQTTVTDGTFMFDLTPIIEQYITHRGLTQMPQNISYRFYIRVTGDNASFPVEIRSFRLINRRSGFVGANAVSAPFPRTTAANPTITASATHTLPQRVVLQNRPFSLQFSSPIQAATAAPNIIVQNARNQTIAITLTPSADRRTWTVNPPSGGFPRHTSYRLLITPPGIRTDGGNTLPNQQIIEFFVP